MLLNASFCVINDFVAFDLIKYQCKTSLGGKKFHEYFRKDIFDRNYDKNHLLTCRKLRRSIVAVTVTQET